MFFDGDSKGNMGGAGRGGVIIDLNEQVSTSFS